MNMVKGRLERNINSFNEDTSKYGGYLYTSTHQLSSLVSNRHITEVILGFAKVKNKKVVDVGCGDGTYTLEINHRGAPKAIFGFDPSKKAIESAREKSKKMKNIRFSVQNIYEYESVEKFDIAIVRGVLHHLYHPKQAIRRINKLAPLIVVAEPNGYNLLLKLIEKLSSYHRLHEEKSFPPLLLDRWIIKSGGKIRSRKFAGLVPFFCPNWIAVCLKVIEPVIERLPVLNMLLCGSYYVVYEVE